MNFYDTCALLNMQEDAFLHGRFYISSITLRELENIKTSQHKDEEIKYKARNLTRLLMAHPGLYEVVIQTTKHEKKLSSKKLPITPDNLIISAAASLPCLHDLIFVTDDLACCHIASHIFRLPVMTSSKLITPEEEYVGYKEIELTQEQLAEFYQHPLEVAPNLHINEYLIVRDTDKNVQTMHKRVPDGLIDVYTPKITSNEFGKVRPYNNDPYQTILLNSFDNHKITMARGAAGTGKTFLALAYLFSQMEKGKLDKIVVFCNTVPTLHSARIGFLPGTRDEKLMESSVGNMLSSKLGDPIRLQQMIAENRLLMLPLCDIRGYDTTNMRAGILISEAQNMDISLMKLALQRIGEDCVCIIDGDYNAQVDDLSFAGAKNGMRRVSEVFRGADVYGEVMLQNIYRSRIAQIAEAM